MLCYWLPLIVWMGLIFWLSSQPQPIDLPSSWQENLVGKTGHVIGYAGLGLLWARMLAARCSASTRQTLMWALLLTVFYAVSDEFHQSFVPGRNGTPLDVLIDAASAGLGLWLWHRRSNH